ncbi:MAG TPA: hypothetical protein VF734_06280 [Pseudonocardiaceae bacterium]
MLLAAVQHYRQLPPTMELALTCEDTGAALRRAGHAVDAVPVLEDTLDFYLRIGSNAEQPGWRRRCGAWASGARGPVAPARRR